MHETLFFFLRLIIYYSVRGGGRSLEKCHLAAVFVYFQSIGRKNTILLCYRRRRYNVIVLPAYRIAVITSLSLWRFFTRPPVLFDRRRDSSSVAAAAAVANRPPCRHRRRRTVSVYDEACLAARLSSGCRRHAAADPLPSGIHAGVHVLRRPVFVSAVVRRRRRRRSIRFHVARSATAWLQPMPVPLLQQQQQVQ